MLKIEKVNDIETIILEREVGVSCSINTRLLEMRLGSSLLILSLLMSLALLCMTLNSQIAREETMQIFFWSLGRIRFLLYHYRIPNNCSVKQKVIYSSSKKSFQTKLVGAKLIDAFDADDLREEVIINKIL